MRFKSDRQRKAVMAKMRNPIVIADSSKNALEQARFDYRNVKGVVLKDKSQRRTKDYKEFIVYPKGGKTVMLR